MLQRIEELIYLGDHIRARLAVAGEAGFIVKLPTRPDMIRLSEGASIRVGWAAEDCHALDAA